MSVTFLFTAIVGKLIYIQIVNSEELQVLALDQWTRDVPLTAKRGAIYDRNGILLADSDTVYTIYARPNACNNKQETSAILSEILGLNREKVYKKLTSKVSEATIASGIDKDTVTAIKASGVTGIYVSQEIKRVYIYGDFMTQILGFTNSDCVGQVGVEAEYNTYLQGNDGYILTETDLIGRELENNVTKYVTGTNGSDIYLTLDYNLQRFAEDAVANAYAEHNPKSAGCIIMNINTGEILAMAQKPSFDLNNVPRDDVNTLLNYSKCTLVTDVYEPGSTFKILTAAIGLDTGVVSRNTTCYCRGYHIVDGTRIKCWRTIGHGSQTFDKGVENSCNVLFMNTALALGTERFYDYLEKFGIGTKTGIDISGEGVGIKIAKNSVKNVDLARIGFGQAIAVTPIELLRASAAVLNGGKLLTPYIVDRCVGTNGNIQYANVPEYTENIIKESTSAAMREILEGVVKNGGGKNAYVEGYRVGGKTGTAQKYENGAIAQGKYVSTFLGFAPADNPEYIALFIVDEPTAGAYYGSVVAAPYMGEIFRKIAAYTATGGNYEVESTADGR